MKTPEQYVLTPTEKESIVNQLRSLQEKVEGSTAREKDDLLAEVDGLWDSMNTLFMQEIALFNQSMDYWRDLGEGFEAKTIWSIYEVEDAFTKHPYKGAAYLEYDSGWGENVMVPIKGDNWLNLFIAADKAIQDSGDLHHVFIEAFEPSSEEGVLKLYTGS